MYLQPQPEGFIACSYTFNFEINAHPDKVWKWLNNPNTFTETQVWPYKVEFYSPDPVKIPNGFNEGVYNIHYGPGINFAGQLITIKKDYRDLQYFYGSYVISIRWIRPCRIEFWTIEKNGITTIKCKVSYWVKPWIEFIWMKLQKLFWATFPRFARKNITK
jgi:hypothetical protein